MCFPKAPKATAPAPIQAPVARQGVQPISQAATIARSDDATRRRLTMASTVLTPPTMGGFSPSTTGKTLLGM